MTSNEQPRHRRRKTNSWAIAAMLMLVPLALALVGLASLSACAPAPPDSGITGTVTIGPTQPVSKPGVPDTRPYSTTLTIAPKAGLHLKRPVEVTSAADGSFKVNLVAGDYVVSSATGQSPPTLTPIEVVVQPQQFANVNANFDSGIR
jgi:hypothetical protein